MEYRLESVTDARLVDIVRLARLVTGKRYSPDYYRKKYNTPLFNGKFYGYITYNAHNQPVSSVMALPFALQLPNGQSGIIYSLADAFTLPECRGKGMMTQMIERLMKTHGTQPGCVFLGISNQNTEPLVTQKLGFVKTHQMYYVTINTGALPLEAISRRLGLKALYHQWLEKKIQPFVVSKDIVLGNSVFSEGFGGMVHDQLFQQAKCYTFNRICQFDGIRSWLKFETGLLVGDVLLPDHCTQDQFDNWLFFLHQLSLRAGLRQIIFQTYEESRLYNLLRSRHTSGPSWAICLKTNDAALTPLLKQLRFVYADFETF